MSGGSLVNPGFLGYSPTPTLASGFAEQVLDLEMQVEVQRSVDALRQLLQLYSVKLT